MTKLSAQLAQLSRCSLKYSSELHQKDTVDQIIFWLSSIYKNLLDKVSNYLYWLVSQNFLLTLSFYSHLFLQRISYFLIFKNEELQFLSDDLNLKSHSSYFSLSPTEWSPADKIWLTRNNKNRNSVGLNLSKFSNLVVDYFQQFIDLIQFLQIRKEKFPPFLPVRHQNKNLHQMRPREFKVKLTFEEIFPILTNIWKFKIWMFLKIWRFLLLRRTI